LDNVSQLPGEVFKTYVEHLLSPTLESGEVTI